MNEPFTAKNLHSAQWRDRLQDAVDQVLAPAEMAQVQAHLAGCTHCSQTHRRLVAVDTSLRNEFAANFRPSANFDQNVFAAIVAMEQTKRAMARQVEQQEFETRMNQLRNGWREFARFHLGSIIGGIATVTAVATALVSAWPSLTAPLTKELVAVEQLPWLPQGWNAMVPITVLASMGIAAAALWITRHLDRRTG